MIANVIAVDDVRRERERAVARTVSPTKPILWLFSPPPLRLGDDDEEEKVKTVFHGLGRPVLR